jgi:flagellar biogenesis protein FliO|uniref:Uncharacterized protein n=1 Tax=Siphoviridae sp. ctmYS12 TaxID=2825652 RepID=A0A8S5P8T4_9CAUD|nr:MAG TPA: hypothetical protein [Siphoviridae sp. ctmYS12]
MKTKTTYHKKERMIIMLKLFVIVAFIIAGIWFVECVD